MFPTIWHNTHLRRAHKDSHNLSLEPAQIDSLTSLSDAVVPSAVPPNHTLALHTRRQSVNPAVVHCGIAFPNWTSRALSPCGRLDLVSRTSSNSSSPPYTRTRHPSSPTSFGKPRDPLQTILAAILRRHHDSAEFTTTVTADVAENLKSELGYYKEHNANIVIEAKRNPADPRLQRSFLGVLCVCLAAIRSAFLGTSRDGALHSEARQFLTQLATMRHSSDVDYLLEANSYWLRYTKLWGPVLLLNFCDGGQIQTLLPSITARLTPAMQERILLFFGDMAHRLRTAHDAGTLPKAFALQLSSILGKPLLLHSTIPSLPTYAEFSDQVEDLSDLHRSEACGIHTHRIRTPRRPHLRW